MTRVPTLGKIIFLYGYPSAGKSTLGALLADRLGLPFLQIDEARTRRARHPWSLVCEEAAAEVGPVIVEGCAPHPKMRRLMHERGAIVIRVHANKAILKQRMAERGWDKNHVRSALEGVYRLDHDCVVDTSDGLSAAALDALVAKLDQEIKEKDLG